MSISYEYEVIAVDQVARCMEIVYKSEGRQTMHIGARLPFEGEALEAVVAMYAPVEYWREQEASVAAPNVGDTGQVTVTPPEPPAPPTYADLRRLAYAQESDPLFFKWQRGETTQQAWLDKVAKIKSRYPEGGSQIPVTEA